MRRGFACPRLRLLFALLAKSSMLNSMKILDVNRIMLLLLIATLLIIPPFAIDSRVTHVTRAKKQKKKETAQRREDKAAEWQRQRENRNLSEPFRGSLTSKNKGDLQEIAGVLGLSEDGTVKDLRTRIIAH